jgi:regulator of protease activity HflC (stomatin/prohibitin superfamily)
MKRFGLILSALLFGLVMQACTTIPAGYVGIKVNNMGANRGVDELPAVTGFQTFLPMTTSIFTYPTFNQQVKYTLAEDDDYANEEVTFTTKDKMKVGVDVALSYFIQANEVPHFYVKFRNDDIEGFSHGFLKNTVRDAFVQNAGHYTIDDVMGDNSIFIAEVRKDVEQAVLPLGVKIDQFGIIGAPRPPASVLDAIDATQRAKQIALTVEAELKQAEAEAKKQVAAAEGHAQSQIADARGVAESNRLKLSSINDTLLEWERLQAQKMSVQKWNGQLPSTVMGGNVPLMLQIPSNR